MKGRWYLTLQETERIIRAMYGARNRLRDRCMILPGFLREPGAGLAVRALDPAGGNIFIRCLKNGFNTVDPPVSEVRRLLRQWRMHGLWSQRAGFLREQRGSASAASILPPAETLRGRRRAGAPGTSPHELPCLRLWAGRAGNGHPTDSRYSQEIFA